MVRFSSVVTGPHLLPLVGLRAAQRGFAANCLRGWILIARKLKHHPCADSQNQWRNQLLLRGAGMQLKPFLLDAWLDQYEHDIE